MGTKEEIINALTCCVNDGYNCGKCNFRNDKHENEYGESEIIDEDGTRYDDYDCSYHLMKAALDLIKNEK